MTDSQAEHFAPAIAVNADGNDDRDRDNATGSPHFDVGRVHPEIGPVAFDRTIEKGLHPLVDLHAQSADLAL
ncbi:hypothetical protein BF95_16770 [Sphingobium sp. Ant17]|nr:hypothetical protein BF95_16770 [Sphingobium sp. Ant17]